MGFFIRTCILCLSAILLFLHQGTGLAASDFSRLFGYRAVAQRDLNQLPQWISAVRRHIKEDVSDGTCREGLFKRCRLERWLKFIDSIRSLPPKAQIEAVNRYANRNPYVLDMDNYDMEDYWAIVKEFVNNGGDCEDYAITKFFSLEWLGFAQGDMRIVILQDTNLRVPHAVMAVRLGGELLIMDNQTDAVISHEQIAHYVPLYSLNEKGWWLHMPSRMRQ